MIELIIGVLALFTAVGLAMMVAAVIGVASDRWRYR